MSPAVFIDATAQAGHQARPGAPTSTGSPRRRPRHRFSPAKSTALEKLGEGERAMRVATSWFQAKVTASNSSAAAID
jgi:hypothetical protein